MVWVKYTTGKETFLGYMNGKLLRLGTRKWAADFRVRKEMHVNEVMKKYKEIVEREMSPYEAAEFLDAEIIDVRSGGPILDVESFAEVQYRWEAIKYIRVDKPPLYQRWNEDRVFDPGKNAFL